MFFQNENVVKPLFIKVLEVIWIFLWIKFTGIIGCRISRRMSKQNMSIRQKLQVFSFLLVICKAGMKQAIKFLRKMGLPRMFTKQVGRVQ
ncbi:hypothetical protein C7R92_29510 [Brevibacillus porteri]|uniref:Transposase n=1 Tax=Brevibacillus porteri TaxID=2126350 RepID=A0ABX5FGK0_9BACL|nr:hypothetical protein C7R92_29510 [Brevibacillus porteri]